MTDLFDKNLTKNKAKFAPLAERMRPRVLAEFVGQEQIVGKGKMLRNLLESDRVPSMIFWGPPGTGKTTLANIIAEMTSSDFVEVSAVNAGLADIRKIVEGARDAQKFHSRRTILFVDEIHRFNKRQQDAFLPHVEAGIIILIGATTENPSFEVNTALLSRCRVFVLEKLSTEEILAIIKQAVTDKEKGFVSKKIEAKDEVWEYLARLSDGDARVALNAIEFAVESASKPGKNVIKLDKDRVKEALQKTHLLYDRAGEEHFNIISALHKSMRGSDADAALYWLGRMLEGGEEPLYIARRVVRFASEDIGLADPNALPQAVAAYQACHFIGMPECNVILAQAVAYCAKAPKSNKLYAAYRQVQKEIHDNPTEPVPIHLRNAPTELMKDLGYGKDYKYNPNFTEPVDQDYLPERLKGKKFLD